MTVASAAEQALNGLIGGHVKLGSMIFTTAAPQIRAGNVIPLAVSSANRLKEFPDLPTFKQLGKLVRSPRRPSNRELRQPGSPAPAFPPN